MKRAFVVDGGSRIRVLPHPKAPRAALELDLDAARLLIRDVEAVLANHDRQRFQREAALLSSLRRLTADRCEQYVGRDRAPFEIARAVWHAITEPLRWVLAKGDAGPAPLALQPLLSMFIGSDRIMQGLRTELARRVKLVGTRHASAGEIDLRHERYVAHALACGAVVPHHVMVDYPASFWRESDMPWVEYFTCPSAWAGSLLGRSATEAEAHALASRHRDANDSAEMHLASLHKLSPALLELRLPEKRAA